jgi:hypothetical protein
MGRNSKGKIKKLKLKKRLVMGRIQKSKLKSQNSKGEIKNHLHLLV